MEDSDPILDADDLAEGPENNQDPLTMSVAAVQAAQQQAQAQALMGVPRRRRVAKRVSAPTPAQMKPAKKASQYEMMQRRQQVQRLRLRGLSIGEIAKQVGVSFQTVQKDMEMVQKENQDKVDKFQQAQFVGESLVVFDEIIHHAWSEFQHADPGSKQRLQSLDLVRVTQHDKLKSLQDTGLIHKAVQQVEHKHTIALPWTPEVKDAVVTQLLQSQLSTTLALPTPDPDHEPGKNVIVEGDVVEEKVAVSGNR